MPKQTAFTVRTMTIPQPGVEDLADVNLGDMALQGSDAVAITGGAVSGTTTSFANAIIAHAGGGQGSAVALTSTINRVGTCATAGDSVLLPVAVPGLSNGVTVINDGAAACNVFPQTGETINTLAANQAFSVPAGAVVVFFSTAATAWQTFPGSIPLNAKFTLNAGAGPLTAAVGDLTGASDVIAQYSGVNASTLTVRTAAQMIADGGYKVGQSYNLRIINTAAGTATLTTATGVTLTGKVAIATNTFVDYVVTITGAATMTFQSAGSGTAP